MQISVRSQVRESGDMSGDESDVSVPSYSETETSKLHNTTVSS